MNVVVIHVLHLCKLETRHKSLRNLLTRIKSARVRSKNSDFVNNTVTNNQVDQTRSEDKSHNLSYLEQNVFTQIS